MAWVVANGAEPTRFRTLKDGCPVWTADVEEALQFYRQQDAELWAAEDEDAWRVLEVEDQGLAAALLDLARIVEGHGP